jgi:hypothetical protein
MVQVADLLAKAADGLQRDHDRGDGPSRWWSIGDKVGERGPFIWII